MAKKNRSVGPTVLQINRRRKHPRSCGGHRPGGERGERGEPRACRPGRECGPHCARLRALTAAAARSPPNQSVATPLQIAVLYAGSALDYFYPSFTNSSE